MNKQPSTIAELFDNWQEGRKWRNHVIEMITRYASGEYYVKLNNAPDPFPMGGHKLLDPIVEDKSSPADPLMLDPKWDRLLEAARAWTKALPADRVRTKEEIELICAIAELTEPTHARLLHP